MSNINGEWGEKIPALRGTDIFFDSLFPENGWSV